MTATTQTSVKHSCAPGSSAALSSQSLTAGNAASLSAPTSASQTPKRHWLAQLDLDFTIRGVKTALSGVKHFGPLRVQRPFYPEGPQCCHVYLLHPPGGLVVGDELNVNANLQERTHSLITTPSAGKIYAVPGGGQKQQQNIRIACAKDAAIEWLPQETLIFDGANGTLSTQFHLQESAKMFAWDIVCLGRPASNLPFLNGSCVQQLEVWQEGELTFFEKNQFVPNTSFMSAKWGMQSAHTSGTLLATVNPNRDAVDELAEYLLREFEGHHWGLTQKNDLFIARYLGNSALVCRKGFEYLWQQLRPIWCSVPAVTPRIWLT